MASSAVVRVGNSTQQQQRIELQHDPADIELDKIETRSSFALGRSLYVHMCLGHRVSCSAECIADRLVGIEVDLPVVVVCV